MQNFLQRGDAINITAPVGGVVSGQALVVGQIFGVVAETAPAGAVVALHRKGVFSLAKTSAQAWAQGDALYWDAANKLVTSVNSGSLLPVGWAAAAAANPSSVGPVLIGQAAS